MIQRNCIAELYISTIFLKGAFILHWNFLRLRADSIDKLTFIAKQHASTRILQA